MKNPLSVTCPTTKRIYSFLNRYWSASVRPRLPSSAWEGKDAVYSQRLAMENFVKNDICCFSSHCCRRFSVIPAVALAPSPPCYEHCHPDNSIQDGVEALRRGHSRLLSILTSFHMYVLDTQFSFFFTYRLIAYFSELLLGKKAYRS